MTATASEEIFEFRLYVAGLSPKSVRAVENLRNVCEERLFGRYEIEVIDLVEEPHRAKADDIVAIPTLVRRLPEPVRKIIGDLSDTPAVVIGLQLHIVGG